MEAREAIVVGAGAAGLWAAARLAELAGSAPAGRPARVLLLEKTPRAGTKVLASGGTRCNVTTTFGPDAAARLFGPRAERFLRRAFRALPPERVRAELARLGVATEEAPLDKVFPTSGRARDVRDALVARAERAGVELRTAAPVDALEPPDGSGLWRVRLASGETLATPLLLCCPGGASYPRTGTTGDGYRWLAALDLAVVEPVPALVPLTSSAAWVRELTGIAVQDARLRLRDPAGRILAERERPVLFTHVGVSGPGAMDVSAHVARARALGERGDFTLFVDLCPALEREALRGKLLALEGERGAPLLARRLPVELGVELPRRLFRAVARAAELAREDPRTNELGRAQRHRLVETLKGLPVPIDGTAGFDAAEVTAGGLALERVDPGSMRVKGRPGLFVFGELLDVDGPIGGLNFQAAFATAELAARAAAAELAP